MKTTSCPRRSTSPPPSAASNAGRASRADAGFHGGVSDPSPRSTPVSGPPNITAYDPNADFHSGAGENQEVPEINTPLAPQYEELIKILKQMRDEVAARTQDDFMKELLSSPYDKLDS